MAERQSNRKKFDPNGGEHNRLDFDHHREERHRSMGGWEAVPSVSADRAPGTNVHRLRDDHHGVPGPFSGVGPRGYRRPDDRICEELHDRLTAHGFIDATEITCLVKNGEVTLGGLVSSRHAKRAAEDVADGIHGVRDVHNNLLIQHHEDAGPVSRKPPRTRTR